jgi:hypothetical protein
MLAPKELKLGDIRNDRIDLDIDTKVPNFELALLNYTIPAEYMSALNGIGTRDRGKRKNLLNGSKWHN